MLEMDGVTLSLAGRDIIDDVSLSLSAGEKLAVLGPNGAGKTTLLKIAAGLLEPDRGSVIWENKDILNNRPRIGYLGHEVQLYEDLTLRQNLNFFARLYGCSLEGSEIESWLSRFDLMLYADSRVEELSRGMKQRLALCRCFFITPQLLILDEPYTGLDVSSIKVLVELWSELSTCPVLFTTHDLDWGLEHGDRWLMLKKGKAVAGGDSSEVDRLKKIFPGARQEKV